MSLILVVWFATSTIALGDWRDDIGFTRLNDALGSAAPTGAGVFVSQVEAGGNAFFPDAGNSDFGAATDPSGEAVTFVNGSAAAHPNPTTSTHATSTVGQRFYGNQLGLASGANTVVVFEASDFLTNVLNGTGGSVPDVPMFTDPADGQQKQFVVQNHSWVGTSPNNNTDVKYLRKLDYLINTFDITTAVGLNNGSQTQLPNLLSQSYNAIAVGRSDGLHSNGLTGNFYGGGRSKPQIVAPIGVTSGATAAVSGAATVLYEVVAGTDGARSEPMRAMLLAGATKEEFANEADPWARTTTQPLDNIFGAGELNIYNSYLMTLGGQYAGSTTAATPVGSYGWDYQTLDPASTIEYSFTIDEGSTATELSIILTWNAVTNTPFTTQTVADMNITLRDSQQSIVDQSLSTVDNVEHIYLTDLEAGTYTLELSTDISTDFGIAWRTETLFDTPSADFNEDGFVDGSDFLVWQRGFGTLIGAGHSSGDADGDGDVDSDDAAILFATYGTTTAPPVASASVPEPSTILLAIGSLLSLLALPRRMRRLTIPVRPQPTP